MKKLTLCDFIASTRFVPDMPTQTFIWDKIHLAIILCFILCLLWK